MLFGNNKILIEILKDKLKLFYGNKVEEVAIPPNISQNIEILDSTGFKKLVDDLLAEVKLRDKKVVIVLSEEVTFHKNETKVDGDQLDLKTAQFIDSVPFDPDKITLKKILNKEVILLVAANKDFYQPIQASVEESGGRVEAVVSLSIFKE